MSSSVYFRFKSQREPSRVTFDGTGISVFELKKEIIVMSRLGDGTDFELAITPEDSKEEYDDDTFIIPRSTTVIARRLPAAKPGRGGAARYVSGKMPQNAKHNHRLESGQSKTLSASAPIDLGGISKAQTEEEKMAAILKLGADQWLQQQEQMANAAPVHRAGLTKSKAQNLPDRPPPSGYICYRCGEVGHWIQACPTNNDPSFDGRPRVKRTTGIPRSFLKTIQKPSTLVNDGTTDDTKQPTGVMVNADGEWVIAEPDQAAWDQYQAKAKISAAAQEAASQGNKALQDLGLECPIDRRLFVDPTKTPCCDRTFCLECITTSLIENDLRCPFCKTDDISLDNLKPDLDMASQVRSYQDDVANESEKLESGSSVKCEPLSPKRSDNMQSSSQDPDKELGNLHRKRPAGSDLPNDRNPPGPAETTQGRMPLDTSMWNATIKTSNLQQSTPPMISAGLTSLMPNSNMGPFTNLNMPMCMPNTVGIGLPNQNAMAMPNAYLGGGWNSMWNTGYAQQGIPMGQPNLQTGPMSYSGINAHHLQYPMPLGLMNMPGIGPNGALTNEMARNSEGPGIFANQQRNSLGLPNHGEEDSAYFRKPVNPHRHQGRRNANRPTDYHEI